MVTTAHKSILILLSEVTNMKNKKFTNIHNDY
jgi:hypothetical protein